MQDNQVTLYRFHQEQEISQRTQNLLDSVKDLWKQLEELSHKDVQSILDMAARLPEPYRAVVMNGIAEKLGSSMVVHYLDILATFRHMTGQEKIDTVEQAATITDSMADLLPIITGLTRRLAVQTLDDLATLAAITVGLFGLSHAESAEQAQYWLYALPQEYARQLAQEHLIAPPSPQFTVTIHMATAPSIAGLSQMKASYVGFASSHSHIAVLSTSDTTQTIDSTIADASAVIAA